MRLAELLAGWGGLEVRGSTDVEIAGIEHDSREVEPGFLFVGIRGFRHDGQAFIPQAVAQGAVAVMVERDPAGLSIPAGIAVIRVPDARAALATAAGRFFGHPSHALRLIGVTGTNGKTTTTFLLDSALRRLGEPTGLIGTIEIRVRDERVLSTGTTPEAPDLPLHAEVAIFRGAPVYFEVWGPWGAPRPAPAGRGTPRGCSRLVRERRGRKRRSVPLLDRIRKI